MKLVFFSNFYYIVDEENNMFTIFVDEEHNMFTTFVEKANQFSY